MRNQPNQFLAVMLATCALSFGSLSIAQPPRGGEATDFSEAAQNLGITEDQLIAALGNERPPNFAEAAEKLNISEETLMEALPPPRGGGR